MSFNMHSKFLLITFSTVTFAVNVSNCELAIAQTNSPETAPVTRPRVTFFEQEQKFGNEEFLQSALSGTTQAIEDPAKLRPNGVSNFSLTLSNSSRVEGSLKTGPLDSVESALSNASFTPSVGGMSIQFSNLIPSSNPQTGTISVTGIINGQNVTGNYNYNAGYSRSDANSLSSGTILLVNPNDSSKSILIQAPPQPFGGNSINGPASFSIGLPKDR
jgi:hypothetical protein